MDIRIIKRAAKRLNMTQHKVDVVQGSMWSFIRQMMEEGDLNGVELYKFGKIVPTNWALDNIGWNGTFKEDRRNKTQNYLRRVPKYMVEGEGDRGISQETTGNMSKLSDEFNSSQDNNDVLLSGLRMCTKTEGTEPIGKMSTA